jgi:hypothetical protein
MECRYWHVFQDFADCFPERFEALPSKNTLDRMLGAGFHVERLKQGFEKTTLRRSNCSSANSMEILDAANSVPGLAAAMLTSVLILRSILRPILRCMLLRMLRRTLQQYNLH